LHGLRNEAETRALIVQENRRYAKRQLIWFRKEPNLTWFEGPGESATTIASVLQFLDGHAIMQNVKRKTETRRTSCRWFCVFRLTFIPVPPFTRAIVIVLDSVGIGELPDADA